MAEVDLQKIAAEMSKLSSSMGAMALASQATREAVAKASAKQDTMQQQIDAQEAQLASQSVLMASQSQVLATKDDWTLSQASPDTKNDLVSEEKCLAMIQDALSQKVAPVFTAAFNHMSSQHSQLESRFTALEQEVKALKIRCAWLEKDLMQNQIEVAKRTIISRNWPEWMTAEDRALSIRNGLQAAGLDAALTDIYTPQFHRENDVISLGAVTIITVPNFNSRKLFVNHNNSRVKCSTTGSGQRSGADA